MKMTENAVVLTLHLDNFKGSFLASQN